MARSRACERKLKKQDYWGGFVIDEMKIQESTDYIHMGTPSKKDDCLENLIQTKDHASYNKYVNSFSSVSNYLEMHL